MLLEDLSKEFLMDLKLKNYSQRTIDTYYYNIAAFLEYAKENFESTNVQDISSVHFKMFIKHLMALGKKATYINTIIKSIKSFYNYLASEDYIESNVMQKVALLKEDTTVIKTFTDEEVSRLIEVYNYKTYLGARNKLIIAMFADTGIRCTELIILEKSWVHDTNLNIFGKGKKWRYVPVTPILRKMMYKYERVREKYLNSLNRPINHDNYFLSRSGRPLTTTQIEVIVREAGVKAKVREEVRCSPHTLRHYAIQANLRNGLDLYSTSRLAGHSNLQTTKRYLMGLETENILERAQITSPLMNIKK